MKKSFGLYFVLIVLPIIGCKHEPIANPNGSLGVKDRVCHPDTVYFENDILPLLKSKCAMPGCHSGANPANKVDLTNYQDIINTADVRPGRPDHSDLYEVITENRPEKRMPPPPYPALSAEEISMIRTWIMQGAKNNHCSDCDSTSVTYLKNIEPLIAANCLGCHNSSVASGQLVLENFNQVRNAVLQNDLIQTIDYPAGTGRMPPSGSMPVCNLNIFKIWVSEGMPLD